MKFRSFSQNIILKKSFQNRCSFIIPHIWKFMSSTVQTAAGNLIRKIAKMWFFCSIVYNFYCLIFHHKYKLQGARNGKYGNKQQARCMNLKREFQPLEVSEKYCNFFPKWHYFSYFSPLCAYNPNQHGIKHFTLTFSVHSKKQEGKSKAWKP